MTLKSISQTLKPEHAGNFGLAKQKFALKCIPKTKLADKGTISLVYNAKEAWKELDSPFIVKLYNCFESYKHIYFLQELKIGTFDLYTHLINSGPISENHTKFYAASILFAFDEMHSKKIACRDLRVSSLQHRNPVN